MKKYIEVPITDEARLPKEEGTYMVIDKLGNHSKIPFNKNNLFFSKEYWLKAIAFVLIPVDEHHESGQIRPLIKETDIQAFLG